MSRTRFFQSRKAPVRHPMLFRNTAAEEVQLKIIPHAHLEALRADRGGENEFLTVCFRVMVGASLTVLADHTGEKALEAEFDPAIDALLSVGERYERLNKFGLSGDEMKHLANALIITDDLQEVSTRKQQAQMYVQTKGFVGCTFTYAMRNLRRLKELRASGRSEP